MRSAPLPWMIWKAPARSKPDQREAQFVRLRDRIEERAARKFLDREFEGTPPGVILRSIDFRK